MTTHTTTPQPALAPHAFRVNWKDEMLVRNNHIAKAIKALKAADYTYDGESKTWSGEGLTEDLRHYSITRHCLIEVAQS